MSLVDYASSDDEQQPDDLLPPPSSATVSTAPPPVNRGGDHRPRQSPSPSPPPRSSSNQQSQDVSPLLPPPMEKLPDASFLLNSPTLSQSVGSDHSSRVAAAMAENASRKREANGSSSSYIRGKIPKSNLPHSKTIPDTGTGLLVPPQLRGRSNVVTEDISRLFVQKKSEGKS